MHYMPCRWAARLTQIPVALSVGMFGSLDGLVASLDESGNLKLLYMGSDPPTSAVGAGANSHKALDPNPNAHEALNSNSDRALNYEQMDEHNVMHCAHAMHCSCCMQGTQLRADG